jgi:L-lactate dehydrogenase (cytochrome)
VDAAVFGQRERDLRNGLRLPPEPTLRAIFDFMSTPIWCYQMLMQPEITLANLREVVGTNDMDPMSLATLNDQQFDPSVTWDDAAWIIDHWSGPFVIKGVLSPEDALRAVDVGASAIVVSNHGGRQLDHAPATIDVLPEIVAAVDGRAEIIIDGGIRRGTDVIKALALGARACMIGRPYVYGLAAGGQAGVERALQILKDEIERAAKLLGCCSLRNVDRRSLRLRQR